MKTSWQLVLISIVHLLAVIIFGCGLFLSRRTISSSSSRDDREDEGKLAVECRERLINATENDRYGRLVLIVIDAWRSDFLFADESMVFTRRLLSSSSSSRHVAFDAHVQTPTVTMPRIKAITSGNVPSFADLFFNFASSNFDDDNLIVQLKLQKKRLLFYGDDTWLRMFPNAFDNSSEGTTSFFVNDFTEVDDNVTRHLTVQLSPSALAEWDVLILHYLGLDHIGHSLGGQHAQVKVKLKEMDAIIHRVYTALQNDERSLIVVLGDHGMTEAGGHGGNTPLETQVPMVFLKPSTRHGEKEEKEIEQKRLIPRKMEQIDLVPTLSSLFNVPIPMGNLGRLLIDVVDNDLLKTLALHENALFLKKKFLSSMEDLSIGEVLSECVKETSRLLHEYCKEEGKPSSFILHSSELWQCDSAMANAQHVLLSRNSSTNLSLVLIGLFVSILMTMMMFLCSRKILFPVETYRLYFLAVLLHTMAMFSSSLIEEEHDIWYFLLNTYLTMELFNSLRDYWAKKKKKMKKSDGGSLLLVFVLHRLARLWTEGRRRRWLMEEDNVMVDLDVWFRDGYSILSLNFISMVPVIFCLMGYQIRSKTMWSLFICSGIGLVIHQIFMSSILPVRMIWFFAFLAIVLPCRMLLLALFLCTSVTIRIEHFVILSLCVLIGYLMGRKEDIHPLTVYCSAAASFFYLGNSNSLSTVDISAGYIGLSDYQPVIVAIQILLNTYAGPLLLIATVITVFNGRRIWTDSLICHVQLVRLISMTSCMCSLFLQRHHLFVWSVFAPKFFYEVMHCFVSLVGLLVYSFRFR